MIRGSNHRTSLESVPKSHPLIVEPDPVRDRVTCSVCLGTCGGYAKCYKCGNLWTRHPEFAGACDLVVPCTVAVLPGRWYTAMVQYKWSGQWNTYAPALASALWAWLSEHSGDLSNVPGGPPTMVTVVPSRSDPMPTPLYRIAIAHADDDVVCFYLVRLGRCEGQMEAEVVGTRRVQRQQRSSKGACVAARGHLGERLHSSLDGDSGASCGGCFTRSGADRSNGVPDAMTDPYSVAASAPIDFSSFPRC